MGIYSSLPVSDLIFVMSVPFVIKDSCSTLCVLLLGSYSFSCDMCKKRFTQWSNLYHHLHIHTVERPYFCYVCTKRFMSHCHLNQHLCAHNVECPLTCGVCKRNQLVINFAWMSTLEYVMRSISCHEMWVRNRTHFRLV
jgi:hypothetical protein